MKRVSLLFYFLIAFQFAFTNVYSQSNQDPRYKNYFFNGSKLQYSENNTQEYEENDHGITYRKGNDNSRQLNNYDDDLRVNEIYGICGADQHSPVTVFDDEGNYVIVWCDYRNGRRDIYCRKFYSDNTPFSDCFQVNDEDAKLWNYGPDIGIFPNGNFIITWSEGSNSIYAQLYSSSGQKQNERFRVNSSPLYDVLNCNAASVAVNAEGNFMISWYQDYYGNNSSGKMNLYARYFDKDGIPYGDEFKVNDTDEHYGGSIGPNRKVVSDLDGNFVIVWSEGRGGLAKNYLQAYNNYAESIGTNQLVSDPLTEYANYYPNISVNNENVFLIIWEEDYRENLGRGCYGITYTLESGFNSEIFEVIPHEMFSKVNWRTTIDVENNFFVSYCDHSTLNALRYSAEGVAVGDSFQIEYDFLNAWPNDINMNINDDGSILMSWAATRNGSTDIWIQQFDDSGQSIMPSFIPYDDKKSAFQTCPSVAIQKNGEFIVVWEDRRNGFKDIYGQLYTPSGTPIGTNLKLNDEQSRNNCEYPVAVIDNNGNYFVAWSLDARDIYAQKISSTGTLIGSNLFVNEQYGYSFDHGIEIHFSDSNEILFSWVGEKPDNTDGIFAQKYGEDL